MTDRPRALAVLIAVFLLGGIVGSGGMYYWLRNSRNSERSAMQPPGIQQGWLRMRDLLQLTPDQERKFGQIMAESRQQMDAVRMQDQPKIQKIFFEQQPKIVAIFADTNRKLMEVLNPEQQKKFEALQMEMSNRGRRGDRFGGRNGIREGDHGMGPPPLH